MPSQAVRVRILIPATGARRRHGAIDGDSVPRLPGTPVPKDAPASASPAASSRALPRKPAPDLPGGSATSDKLPALRGRPLVFLFSYIRRHPGGHLIVLLSVLVAVTCAVSTQYGMKYLIDIVAQGRQAAGVKVWYAFALLCGLVAADNLCLARRRLCRAPHLRRGDRRHPPRPVPPSRRPFADLFRRTAARRAGQPHNLDRQRRIHILENTGAWNVLPPSFGVHARRSASSGRSISHWPERS